MGAALQMDIHGAKGGSSKPKQPTEAPDSLRSIAVAKMLIAVGEGEFDGVPKAQDIYLDNTPLADPNGNLNFPNVKWEWRSGSVEQGYIQGIPSIENEISEGVELRSDTPYVRAIDRLELDAKQELEDLISEITDPLEYVPTNAYLKNDSVRLGQRLFMAIAPVPAAVNGSNAPPNATYWVDIGSIAETANGLAQAVAKNTTDITTIDGKVTVNASALQAVQSSFRDDNGEGDLAGAVQGWYSTAKVAETSRTQATQHEAMATRVTDISAQVADNKASIGILEKTVATNESATASRFTDMNTTVEGNTSSVSQLDKAVTDLESSIASSLERVNSRVDDAEAEIVQEAATRADAVESLGTRMGYMEASFVAPQDNGEGDLAGAIQGWDAAAKIAEESKVRATALEVQARKSETLEASFNNALDKTNGEIQKTNASVQTTSQALAALDGKASTMWAVKMQVNAQGQYVAASVGMGIENGPGGLQSNFLVSADTFAVVNGINGTLASPFAVTGGQVFMNSAFIMDGSITNAKIGNFISSTNYVAGTQGWAIYKNGLFELNGTGPGQSRLSINNSAVRMYHANGVLGIELSL